MSFKELFELPRTDTTDSSTCFDIRSVYKRTNLKQAEWLSMSSALRNILSMSWKYEHTLCKISFFNLSMSASMSFLVKSLMMGGHAIQLYEFSLVQK